MIRKHSIGMEIVMTTKACPMTSPLKAPKATKLMLAALSMSSMHMSTTMALLLVTTP